MNGLVGERVAPCSGGRDGELVMVILVLVVVVLLMFYMRDGDRQTGKQTYR